jgi:hypothetical protein
MNWASGVSERRARRLRKRQSTPLRLLLAGIVTAAVAGCATPPPWGEFPLRTLPEDWRPQWRQAAPGIRYSRWPGGEFPPFHLVRVDPQLAEIKPLPPFPEGKRAGALFEKYPAAAGVLNGTPFRYRSASGGREMDPVGVWIADGRYYSRQEERWGVLWCEADTGRVRVASEWNPARDARWAAGGFLPIIREGRNVGIHGARHARTAAGVTPRGRTLYFLVIEGEQLGNPGVTSREAASVLLRLGVENALNLDGGRSATLLLRDDSGDILAEVDSGRRELACFILLRSTGR